MAARREEASTDLQHPCSGAGDLSARSFMDVVQPTSVTTATINPTKNMRVMDVKTALMSAEFLLGPRYHGDGASPSNPPFQECGKGRRSGQSSHSRGVSGLGRDWAQRKPIVADRCSGLEPLRVAVRSMMILLFHEPPRTPLYRPLGGPV